MFPPEYILIATLTVLIILASILFYGYTTLQNADAVYTPELFGASTSVPGYDRAAYSRIEEQIETLLTQFKYLYTKDHLVGLIATTLETQRARLDELARSRADAELRREQLVVDAIRKSSAAASEQQSAAASASTGRLIVRCIYNLIAIFTLVIFVANVVRRPTPTTTASSGSNGRHL